MRHILLPPFLVACLPLAARAIDLTAGPMVGHVTDRSARVWLQFPVAGEVTVTAIDIEFAQPVSSLRTGLQGPVPYVCDFPLNNLQANKSYRVEIKFDGMPVKIPGPGLVVRTAPAPGEETQFSLAFGSNLNPNGRNSAPIFNAITKLKPRLFLFLGNAGFLPTKLDDFPDNRRNAFRFIADLHSRIRREPDLQELFRTTPCYAIYNDRDFGTPDAGKSFPYVAESLLAFQRFWPNPDWGTPQNPGCYCSFSVGDVDIFLLDSRTFRESPAPATAPAATRPNPATMFGQAQLEWLRQSLKSSRASFKILASACTLFGDDGANPDSWSRFPEEQASFTHWLVDNRIKGVVSIAGGQSMGRITRLDLAPPGTTPYTLFSLGCSTLTAIPAALPKAPASQPGLIGEALSEDNFGTLDFGGQHDHRFVTLRLRDETGKTRAEQTLFITQLR